MIDISRLTQPRLLSEDDLLFFQDDFELVLYGPQRFPAFQALHEYFSTKPLGERQKYYYTYWQWYVRLAWESVTQLDEDTFVRMIELTLPTAVLLDIDIEEKFLFYLHRAVSYSKEQEAVFHHVRAVLEQSNLPLNMFNTSGMTIGNVYKQATALRGREETDIQLAEYYAQVEEQLCSDKTIFPDFTPTEKLPMVKRLVEFVFFFSLDHDISQIVWEHYEERYDALDKDGGSKIFDLPEEEPATEVPPASTEPSTQEESVPKDPQPPEPTAPPSPVTVQPQKTAAPAAPAHGLPYSQIHDLIDARFPKDARGQYENVAGVLALLESLASEYEDEQIRSLYYFDAASGTFRWNERLIS